MTGKQGTRDDGTSVNTEIPDAESVIIMNRVYDAPRDLVWEAITEPQHVARWWGGPGFTNPVCEMDVRPGGQWRHVMRFPDGHELHMSFVFVEVSKPRKLVWQSANAGSDPDRSCMPSSTASSRCWKAWRRSSARVPRTQRQKNS